jgi:hypothetical protein
MAAVAWNAMCYMETLRMIELGILPAELDDRPERMKRDGLNLFKDQAGMGR